MRVEGRGEWEQKGREGRRAKERRVEGRGGEERGGDGRGGDGRGGEGREGEEREEEGGEFVILHQQCHVCKYIHHKIVRLYSKS